VRLLVAFGDALDLFAVLLLHVVGNPLGIRMRMAPVVHLLPS
jgi:hypothetical protein